MCRNSNPQRKIEFKKIALGVIGAWAVILVTAITVFGLSETIGQALVYGVIVSYVSYCGASAMDKYGLNKYGKTLNLTEEEDENGTEIQ